MSIASEEAVSSARSRLQPWIYWLAVAIGVFHIWVNSFGILSEIWRNSLHMGLLAALGFLMYPFRKRSLPNATLIIDVILSVLAFRAPRLIEFSEVFSLM